MSLVFLGRRLVPQPRLFVEAQRESLRGAPAAPFWAIFKGPHLRRTLAASGWRPAIFGEADVMITRLPTCLRMSLGLSVGSSAG